MKTGKNLMELAAEVMATKEAKKDFIVPSAAMKMSHGVLEFGENGNTGRWEPTEVFHEQLSSKLQIPKAYYDRMRIDAPELLENNVNTWLQRSPERRMVRTVSSRARALLSDRYRPLDNNLILEATLPILAQHQDIQVISAEATDRRLYLQVVTPRLQGEVSKGDVVQMGMILSNSEVGLGSVRVEPLLYRLVCLNGMIMASALKRHHVGKQLEADDADYYTVTTREADNHAFLLKIQDTVRHSFDQIAFEQTLERIQITANNKIEAKAITASVEEITKRFDFSKAEGESILNNLIAGGSLTQWGIANAVTAMANDSENYDRAVEYERIGGRIIDLTPKEWSGIAA